MTRLTPDQIRLRIAALRTLPHEDACWRALDLLEEVLPALVAPSTYQQRMGVKAAAEMLAEAREDERRVLYGDPDATAPGLRGRIDA